ncbi:MAG: HPr family phosphocarrier protein [Candidatus Omnitrophica bacterium]|nr:HPr family phosphocarrier protein [Candidatus Omnitrophota bacterium]
MNEFLKQTVKIGSSQGLHARPASLLVKLAGNFESEITLIKDGQSSNAKSMMSVLMLAAEGGSTVEIHVTGKDAEKAMKAVSAFLTGDQDAPEGRFSEEN